ncbi:MAG: TetR/AcrR family transcriptional regulator [Cytophagales bacterium]|nr:TetR/AcrR family transcriptional regulator [Cytophagales bacterium]
MASEEKILRAAKELIWAQGLRKVSVEEICERAGVSKMTFYRKFENKEKLALLVFQKHVERSIAEYRSFMDARISFSEKMESFVRFKLREASQASKALLQDVVSEKFPALQAYNGKISKENEEMFLSDLRAAQERGEIRKEIRLEFVQDVLHFLQEKATDEKFLSRYATIEEATQEVINYLLYGLFPVR